MPAWPDIRAALAATWPMVSASYIPLLSLVLARLLGASPPHAGNAGLVTAIVLLMIYGWSSGRAAHLRGRQQLAMQNRRFGAISPQIAKQV